jgi:hypothetical protein
VTDDLRSRIATVLREHRPPAHVTGLPADEFDCCADAVLAVVQPELDQRDAEVRRLHALFDEAKQSLPAEQRRLLAISRMVFDGIAEGHPFTRDEAADLAQRIVDETGHSVTDEPALGPSFRVEIKRLGEQNALLITMLERIPEVHTRFHVVDGELADVCADWCYACKLGQAEAERDRLKAALGPVPLLGEPCGSTEPAGGRLTCTLPARHDVHYAAGSGTIWRCICTPTDAEAAVARVRALAAAATRAECGGGWDLDPAAVLAALDQPKEPQ